MMTVHHSELTTLTFLAPGQRYMQLGVPAWRLDEQITISRLDQDEHGIPRVTFRYADGREATAYASQIEAAVAEGQIAPVAGSGYTARS